MASIAGMGGSAVGCMQVRDSPRLRDVELPGVAPSPRAELPARAGHRSRPERPPRAPFRPPTGQSLAQGLCFEALGQIKLRLGIATRSQFALLKGLAQGGELTLGIGGAENRLLALCLGVAARSLLACDFGFQTRGLFALCLGFTACGLLALFYRLTQRRQLPLRLDESAGGLLAPSLGLDRCGLPARNLCPQGFGLLALLFHFAARGLFALLGGLAQRFQLALGLSDGIGRLLESASTSCRTVSSRDSSAWSCAMNLPGFGLLARLLETLAQGCQLALRLGATPG